MATLGIILCAAVLSMYSIPAALLNHFIIVLLFQLEAHVSPHFMPYLCFVRSTIA